MSLHSERAIPPHTRKEFLGKSNLQQFINSTRADRLGKSMNSTARSHSFKHNYRGEPMERDVFAKTSSKL